MPAVVGKVKNQGAKLITIVRLTEEKLIRYVIYYMTQKTHSYLVVLLPTAGFAVEFLQNVKFAQHIATKRGFVHL